MWRFCGRNARNFTSIRKKNMVCRRVSDSPVFSESDLLDMVFFDFLSVWSFQKAVIQKRDFLPGADKDNNRNSVLKSTLFCLLQNVAVIAGGGDLTAIIPLF